MKNFIKGSLFILLVIPIVENLSAILSQLTKHICTEIAVKTYNLEQSLPEEGGCAHAIGFEIPSSSDYDEEEDDE